MDWKKENPKTRYIDEITYDEAKQIAFLAAGKPEDFRMIELEVDCNANNIPHVKIYYEYFEMTLGEDIKTFTGIFSDLNIYSGESFHSCYCQKEIFELFKQLNFD